MTKNGVATLLSNKRKRCCACRSWFADTTVWRRLSRKRAAAGQRCCVHATRRRRRRQRRRGRRPPPPLAEWRPPPPNTEFGVAVKRRCRRRPVSRRPRHLRRRSGSTSSCCHLEQKNGKRDPVLINHVAAWTHNGETASWRSVQDRQICFYVYVIKRGTLKNYWLARKLKEFSLRFTAFSYVSIIY